MTTNDTHATPAKDFQIAGFWVRLCAFIIDVLVLKLVGMCLGLLLSEYLIDFGQWGIAVGFGIAVTYFTLLESNIGGGQSVGKTFLGLKVVSREGECLNLIKAVVRASVACSAYFLWEAVQTGMLFTADSVPVLVLPLISIIYLYIFNRQTRQTLQDLVIDSVVVEAKFSEPKPFTKKIWRAHYGILLIILASFASLTQFALNNQKVFAVNKVAVPSILAAQFPQMPTMSSLAVPALSKAFSQQAGVTAVNSIASFSFRIKASDDSDKHINKEKTEHILIIGLLVNDKQARAIANQYTKDLWSGNRAGIADMANQSQYKEITHRYRQIILNNYPDLSQYDAVTVSVGYGYNIGIDKGVVSNFSFSFSLHDQTILGPSEKIELS